MPARAFRLRPFMRRGNPSAIQESWTRFATPEDARAGAKRIYHDDRVARVMLTVDGTGAFVEWIER